MDHKKEEAPSIDWQRLADDYLSHNLPLGVLVADKEGKIRLWNTWLEIQSGRSAREVIGRSLEEVLGGEQGGKVWMTVRRVLESGLVMFLAQRFHKYLIPIPLSMSSSPLSFMQQSAQIAPLREGGEIVGVIILIQDMTEQVQRERELRQEIEEVEALNQSLRKREEEIRRVKEEWERTFDAVPDLIAILDRDHRVVRLNKAMAERLRVSQEEGLGLRCYEAVHGLPAPPLFCPHARLMGTGEAQEVEVFEERLNGFFQIKVVPLYDEKENLIGSVHIAHDISERKKMTDLLERFSYQDGLTGVANRRKFDETLKGEWRRAQREEKPLSLIMVDIDFFKKYNDLYGHRAGDECLKMIARALEDGLRRSGDLVARYGGEEFALILPQTDKVGAERVAETLKSKIERLKIPHADSPIAPWVTVSLGTASLIPHPDSEADELLREADEALYRAKKEGRNRVVVGGG